MTTIAIISAGTRTPSQSGALAGCFADRLQGSASSPQPLLIELRVLATSILLATLTGESDAGLRSALQCLRQADAMIMVTPLHNGSYSGLFKMFVDLIEPDAIRGKPVLLAASGGTTRASLALDGPVRSLFGCLRALVAPTVVLATPADWAGAGTPGPELGDRIARASDEIAVLIGGLAP